MVADQAGEGPKAFQWRGAWWMITDVWRGLAVYRSQDAVNWTRQPDLLLQQAGQGRSSLQVTELIQSGDRLRVERDAPTRIALGGG